jgi:hypothetical protein
MYLIKLKIDNLNTCIQYIRNSSILKKKMCLISFKFYWYHKRTWRPENWKLVVIEEIWLGLQF